jgi:hypothetical protein
LVDPGAIHRKNPLRGVGEAVQNGPVTTPLTGLGWPVSRETPDRDVSRETPTGLGWPQDPAVTLEPIQGDSG